MNDLPETIPVAIVGAGPTGLTMGLLLAAYGVRSVILDQNAAPMDIPRAIVIDDEGLRTIQVFGGNETYLPKTVTAEGAVYADDAGDIFGRVGAGPEIYGFPKRNYINQPEFEADLGAHVARSDLCSLHFSTSVLDAVQHGDGVDLTFVCADGSQGTIRAAFVVAADGGRSPIRERLGIPMQGSTYAQDWIVMDTLNDPDGAKFSRFFCSNARPHVSIPAPQGGRRYEFMLLPGETHDQVLADGFVEGLTRPFRDLRPEDIVRKTVYTFHARMATRWRDGRILLAGDAAHMTPPFAGQGMNAGLRDAANLSWKLAAVLNGGADPAILDSYGEERRDPAWAMIQLAVVMGDIVMPIDPGQLAFREHLLKALVPFPAVQDYLLQMKFKPKPRVNCGLVLDLDAQPFEGSLVGEMVPQPEIVLDGASVKLDAALGPGFGLVAQDPTGAEALATMAQATYLGLPLGRVFLQHGAGVAAMPTATTSSPFARPLRTHRDQVLLVRPDRYCAAAFTPGELQDGLRRYAALFQA
jgi:3-(3-hydroxy-phenyl)propionate hydroxylase